MAGLGAAVARLVSSFDASALPQEAARRAKLAVLDCVGVALAGLQEPAAAIVRELVLEGAGKGAATLWGTARRAPLADAALANGTAAHALDYDDMNRAALGHPSAVLVPVLFALGERLQLPGRRLIEGYVVGLEIMARLGRVFGRKAYRSSWHPTSMLGAISACAAGCYLLELDHDRTLHALGIAVSEASGVKGNFGTMTKSLHVGAAARKGLVAALLAGKGFTSSPEALDGAFGWVGMLGGGAPEAFGEEIDPETLEIVRSGLVYKLYSCCGGLHSVVDNAILLGRRHGFDSAAIAEIECRVHPERAAYLDRPQPADPLQAKFSIQYCVAVALLDGCVGLAQFSEEALARSDTRALMRRIRVVADAELEPFGSELRVRDLSGAAASSRRSEPRGAAGSPASESELLEKFLDCATTVFSRQHAEQAARALLALEREEDVGRVVRLLRADAPPDRCAPVAKDGAGLGSALHAPRPDA